jgi:hypothetical protein
MPVQFGISWTDQQHRQIEVTQPGVTVSSSAGSRAVRIRSQSLARSIVSPIGVRYARHLVRYLVGVLVACRERAHILPSAVAG